MTGGSGPKRDDARGVGTAITRWIIAGVAVALIVCLLVWARGSQPHHRGDEVGSLHAVARVER